LTYAPAESWFSRILKFAGRGGLALRIPSLAYCPGNARLCARDTRRGFHWPAASAGCRPRHRQAPTGRLDSACEEIWMFTVLRLRKDHEQGEGYSVIFEGRGVGRIFFAGAGAPKTAPGFGDWNFTSGSDAVAGNMETRRAVKPRERRMPAPSTAASHRGLISRTVTDGLRSGELRGPSWQMIGRVTYLRTSVAPSKSHSSIQ